MPSYWDRDDVYVIFEAGLNHNGDPDLAMKLVEAASAAGADAVKFQKRDIQSLATQAMLDSPETRFPSLGSTYREVRSQLELTFDVYKALRSRAHSLGLHFMVTPFDSVSLDFVLEVGVDSLKIASHSVANPRFLREVAVAGLPVVMSSGMVTLDELDAAVGIFTEAGTDLALLHCASEYPTEDQGANLKLIQTLADRYQRVTGFSGHELGTLHTLLALGMGARIIERHVTLDNSLEGFDHKMSLNTHAFANLMSDIRRASVVFGDGVKSISQIESATRSKYRVSMVSSRAIRAGEVLSAELVVYKNPGTGIPAIEEQIYFGRSLKTSVPKDELLKPEMFL